MPGKISKAKVSAAITELDRVRKRWMRRRGVTALDVGYKIQGGKLTDEVAIRVHVTEKKPTEALEQHERFTSRENPEKLGSFPIDIIEASYGPARGEEMVLQPEVVDRHSRVDPLVGGISAGNPRITAGTLGAIVWDKSDGEPCLLSNWHVLCGSDACAVGEPIYQPGRADGGSAADTVAMLKRWRLDRHADAALARLTGARGYSRDILELEPVSQIENAPVLGMHVAKSGRTTGLTQGIIDGVSASVRINYGGRVGVIVFEDQLHIVPRPPWPSVDYEVSRGGDSGSVWIDEESGRAVGLHFAGETSAAITAEHAIANRMTRVAEILNFSFTPVFRPPVFVDDRLRDLLRRLLCERMPGLCAPLVRYEAHNNQWV